MFLVVGSGDTVLTSTDGVAWTKRHAETAGLQYPRLTSVLWAHGRFYATGYDDAGDLGTVLYSPDGITWPLEPKGSVPLLASMATTGSCLVGVGYGGAIVTSSDAASAHPRSRPMPQQGP